MSDTFTSWRRQNIGALLLNLRRVRDLNPVSTPHCVRHRRNRVPYSHPTHMTQVMCFCSSPVNKQSYEKGSRKIVCLCGERGIRTLEPVAQLLPFQGSRLNHSRISPFFIHRFYTIIRRTKNPKIPKN